MSAKSPTGLKYKRILLKLTGQALGDKTGRGVCPESIHAMAKKIASVHQLGVEVVVVIGGGNIYRGGPGSRSIDRATGDYMGILATIINGLALQDALEKNQVPTRVQSALPMVQVAEPFIRRRAIRHLEKGRVVILAGGTGNPYFTTDTAAALRAKEIGAEVLLKATKVDGIYERDPHQYPEARRFKHLTYHGALRRRLKVMDATAFSLCADHNIRIFVFNVFRHDSIKHVVEGTAVGTLVTGGAG